MATQVFKDFNEMMAYLRHRDKGSKLKEVEEPEEIKVEPKKKPAKKASKKK